MQSFNSTPLGFLSFQLPDTPSKTLKLGHYSYHDPAQPANNCHGHPPRHGTFLWYNGQAVSSPEHLWPPTAGRVQNEVWSPRVGLYPPPLSHPPQLMFPLTDFTDKLKRKQLFFSHHLKEHICQRPVPAHRLLINNVCPFYKDWLLFFFTFLSLAAPCLSC